MSRHGRLTLSSARAYARCPLTAQNTPVGDEHQRDTRRAVKARFDPDVFEHINKIRRDRGVEWSTVILYGIAEVEQEIPPYHEQYRTAPKESSDEN